MDLQGPRTKAKSSATCISSECKVHFLCADCPTCELQKAEPPKARWCCNEACGKEIDAAKDEGASGRYSYCSLTCKFPPCTFCNARFGRCKEQRPQKESMAYHVLKEWRCGAHSQRKCYNDSCGKMFDVSHAPEQVARQGKTEIYYCSENCRYPPCAFVSQRGVRCKTSRVRKVKRGGQLVSNSYHDVKEWKCPKHCTGK